MKAMRPSRDQELVQIVDAALADAAARSGDWLACRPGCTQCCHGVFAVSALDAVRLRDGLAKLGEVDPARASRVVERAQAGWGKLAADFPGNVDTGVLGVSEDEEERFAEFANEEPCPVLDPATGTCDLYAARPLTCRVFGPPVVSEDGLGMCELCFVGASESEMAAGEMYLTHGALEEELNDEVERDAGAGGSTIVAFALVR